MADEKNIYGTYNPDGTRNFPPVNIDGASYTQPCTTVNIGTDKFVVIPVNFVDAERLEALKTAAASQQRYQTEVAKNWDEPGEGN